MKILKIGVVSQAWMKAHTVASARGGASRTGRACGVFHLHRDSL